MATAKNGIHVFDGASERVECVSGKPFAPLPTSFALISPTSGGKTQILLNIVLRYYKDQFARIFCFSPTIHQDEQYAPLRKRLGQYCDQQKEPLMFPDFSMAKLGEIISQQRTIVESCRQRKAKPPQICIILDDLGERGDVFQTRKGGSCGGSHMLSLAVSGRHAQITWIICAQKMSMISRGIMANVRCLCVGRLRSQHEVEALSEELSNLAGSKKAAMELLEYATKEPFSFLFVRLDAKTRKDTFWLRFETRIVIDKDEHGLAQRRGVHDAESGSESSTPSRKNSPKQAAGKRSKASGSS